MAFVNEYIKIEDVSTYRLFELQCKYNDAISNKSPKEIFNNTLWTIDKERDIWLRSSVSIMDPKEDFFIPLGYAVYIFYVNGIYYETILKPVSEESSHKYSEDPFVKTRELISIRVVPEDNSISNEKLAKIVDEALKTYPARNFPDKNIIKLLEEALNIYGIDGQKGPYGLGDTRKNINNIITKLKI